MTDRRLDAAYLATLGSGVTPASDLDAAYIATLGAGLATAASDLDACYVAILASVTNVTVNNGYWGVQIT